MKNSFTRIIVTILIVAIAISCTGCITGRIYGKPLDDASALDTSQGTMYLSQIVIYMNDGNLEGIENLGYHFGQDGGATFDDFWADWEAFEAEYGQVSDSGLTESYSYGDEPAFVAELAMENGGTLMLQMYFSEKFELYELYIYESADEYFSKVTMPDDVEEIDVVVNEGTAYELAGKITMPKGAQTSGETYQAAVLVDGDGANTMDMTAGNTYLYRDMAWGLAEQGIITIRYEKRTLTYQDEVMDENADKSVFTVAWEYTDDANAAAQMLAAMDCVDSDQIYYIGHSQGAQVGSRADEEAGGLYAGFVLINSSPRYWYDVIYDQYINYGLCDRESDEIYYLVSKIKTERNFIADGSCSKLDEEELTEDFILSRAAAFWVDYLDYDYVQSYRDLGKPMLIVQGETDYQIVPETDYVQWQEDLADCSFVTFKEYEGLDHLMMPSEGIFFGHYKEYDIPNTADETFISDVAEFLKANQ